MTKSPCLGTAVAVIAALALAGAAFADGAKVEICHFPLGNPESPQTITVSEKAVSAHLAHGDLVGPCVDGCQDNTATCDDENACTEDICLSDGSCANLPVDCDDSNPCTADACDPDQGCVNTPVVGKSCDDWNVCTEGDVCVDDGSCSGQAILGCCTTDLDCIDNRLCTNDLCIDNTCLNEPRDCSLAAVCGIPDLVNRCIVSFCSEGDGGCVNAPVSCDDGDICTDDYCDAYLGCFSLLTNNPPEQPSEVTCDDGLDNDCDGIADWPDPDCPPAGPSIQTITFDDLEVADSARHQILGSYVAEGITFTAIYLTNDGIWYGGQTSDVYQGSAAIFMRPPSSRLRIEAPPGKTLNGDGSHVIWFDYADLCGLNRQANSQCSAPDQPFVMLLDAFAEDGTVLWQDGEGTVLPGGSGFRTHQLTQSLGPAHRIELRFSSNKPQLDNFLFEVLQ